MDIIKPCHGCGECHHIDNVIHCDGCHTYFCGCCKDEQGIVFSETAGGRIFLCTDCIKKYKEEGIQWIINEVVEDPNESSLIKALHEYERRYGVI